jgi:predicted 2-oxoglutarate/Fe(II)-dependent dioxygenase YbiX
MSDLLPQYWMFNDIYTNEMCDEIIKAYTQDGVETQPPSTFDEHLNVNFDKNIRNVERVILPTHNGVGGHLAAAGLTANNQAWKFDITNANQAEFLQYPVGGRYQTHMDLFLDRKQECRKLSVLAFLNDDFIGGKFYFQNSHKKYYPPQEKGTVLVFPSFFMHGVEDIEEGTRYSAICWMVGPFLK